MRPLPSTGTLLTPRDRAPQQPDQHLAPRPQDSSKEPLISSLGNKSHLTFLLLQSLPPTAPLVPSVPDHSPQVALHGMHGPPPLAVSVCDGLMCPESDVVGLSSSHSVRWAVPPSLPGRIGAGQSTLEKRPPLSGPWFPSL